MTLLASRVDALAQRLDGVGTSLLSSQDHQLRSTLSARLVVCRDILLLSATIVPLPLSKPTLCTIATPLHREILTLILTVLDGRAIPTPLIGTLTHHHKMLCSHLGILVESLQSTPSTTSTQIKLGESHGAIDSK